MSATATAVDARGIGPVAAADRLDVIDILRGFALLGILLVNFGGPVGQYFPRADAAAVEVVDILAESSFYPLFSFLFGLGFALQLSRAKAVGLTHIYLRRLLVLFLIGSVHGVLIWNGDVLVSYSIFGLLLLPLQKLPPRGLLAIVLLLAAAGAAALPIRDAVNSWRSGADLELREGLQAEETRIINNRDARERREGGTYAWNVTARWQNYGARLRRHTDWFFLLMNDILMLFILGLYVGKQGYLSLVAQHRRAWMTAAAIGLFASIAGTLYDQYTPDGFPALRNLMVMAGDLGPTAFYIAAIALAVAAGGRAARALSVFTSAGRMGLTNYLMQSAVMTLLFYPYGLHLTEPGMFGHVVVNIAFFFLVQVPISRWWLARFQFGPAEWVWRSATYGRMQPMRQDRALPLAAPVVTR